jgi:putative Ca2+/H+ antiporter (TMEM165/GDT1 family)
MIEYFFSGLIIKLLAGFDDAMIHILIISNLTSTKRGRFSFILGIFLSILLVIMLSFLFAKVIKFFPYSNYISALLILIIAFIIYSEKFEKKTKEKIKIKIQKIKFSKKRFLKLVLTGFLISFVTMINDLIVYSSLFLTNLNAYKHIILGIFAGTIIHLSVVFYFSKQFSKIPYKKEITVFSLIILSFLIMFKIL